MFVDKYDKHLTNLCSGYGVDVMGLPVELVADVVIQRLLLVSSDLNLKIYNLIRITIHIMEWRKPNERNHLNKNIGKTNESKF
jgi:hypothetical protein